MIAATRLRRGSTNSARGAAGFVAEALTVAKAAGANNKTGLLIARFDSAYYAADVLAACRRSGARFSVTARMNTAVKAAITTIQEQAWVPIWYPNVIGAPREALRMTFGYRAGRSMGSPYPRTVKPSS